MKPFDATRQYAASTSASPNVSFPSPGLSTTYSNEMTWITIIPNKSALCLGHLESRKEK